ncbi:MAG: hypothetical protein NTZ78_13100 [Candidatus Aureabacteria bacterium]|nr:hypothetical protein [Candidatus Auribacterota bacterium]
MPDMAGRSGSLSAGPITEMEAIMMNFRHYRLILFLLALAASQGCGKRDQGQDNLRALEEKHAKEIARLEESHRARVKTYEQQLAARDAELRGLRDQLAAARNSAAGARAAKPGSPAQSPAAASGQRPQPLSGTQMASPSAAEAGTSASGKEIDLLEQFAQEYSRSLEGSDREQFGKDLQALIALLKAPSGDTPPLQRKEAMVKDIQEKIGASSDSREKAGLENRLKRVESASEEDLPGVLNYLQKMDNIENLNKFMRDYNISRDELADYGIEPPPRTGFRPEPKEIANNLKGFVEDYAPLVDPTQREQYRSDFDSLAANLSKRLTDEEVMQGKDRMLKDLQTRYATAPENEQQRIKNRIARLENSDVTALRPRLQFEMLRDIDTLAKKYNIPPNELRQTGVLFPGRQHNQPIPQ